MLKIIFICIVAIYAQNPVFYCNFNDEITLKSLCGGSNDIYYKNCTVGTVLNESVPDVIPSWSVTDYTSISTSLN
jgi:hypothetical protein